MNQTIQESITITFIFILGFAFSTTINYAQPCSAPIEAMTAKYWQSREKLNKHFVLNDRAPSGCVGDGIGQQVDDLCKFSKAGYGLPATSIVMAPNGGWGMIDRNNSTLFPEWYDPDCAQDGPAPGTSTVNKAKHNYLEFGSETPHQMGWYWATLATEYELLRLNGQHEEMQRTLEELFLALQAYRRLDMQAQCMVRKRYDEIADDFEVENCMVTVGHPVFPFMQHVSGDCLCSQKYTGAGHPNFDNPCEDICDYQPDLSGYSGFFLREDATQALEILHDSTEDRYNIDLVSSAYAMSLAPPCIPNFSQPCYLVRTQNFMSQDGMAGLMIELALIKRYIPENAEVTTCDSMQFKPLEMAERIAVAMVDRVDNSFRNRISWPGSPGCCAKETFLSNSEGGQLIATIHGFKKAANFIDDGGRHSSVGEWFNWSVILRGQTQTSYNTNAKFWLRLKAIGWDMGDERHATKTLFHSAASTQNLEILILLNNLLHPEGANLSTNQTFFEQLLCKAPCGGPCYKQPGYGGTNPEDWPDFDCPNEPEWVGQRWETHGYGENRLFNGLDYMALHNIYRLHYGLTNRFYNPERPTDYSALGAGKIEGPDVLCPVSTGNYEIVSSYPSSTISNIVWKTSTNLEVLNAIQKEADIRANAAMNPSFIQASFNEIHPVVQRYLQPGLLGGLILLTNGDTLDDECYLAYRKPISTTLSTDAYTYESKIDHCLKEYEFRVNGLITPGVEFHWVIELLGTSIVYHANGAYVFYSGTDKFPVQTGALRVTLTVMADGCAESNEPYIESLICLNGGMGLRVNPNPGQDQIAVEIIPGEASTLYTLTDPNGVRIRITPQTGGNILTDTRIYSNGEYINVSNLQNGVYLVQASEADLIVPLSTILVIAR